MNLSIDTIAKIAKSTFTMDRTQNRSILQQHTARLLRIIREDSPVTRVDLAHQTGFDSATVTKITKALIRKKLIQETALGESTGGRRPKLLEINSDARTVIGVNVDLDCITLQAMNLAAQPIKTKHISNPDLRHPDQVLRATSKAIASLVDEFDDVLGVGIAFPGVINAQTGVCVYNAYFGWHDVPIRGAIQSRLDVPVKVDNDVRGVALAEQWFGAARNMKNVVCLRVDIGVGAAAIIGGEVYQGSHNIAGEVGHSIVQVNGPLCVCGNYGCLEALASASAIERIVRGRLKENYPSMLSETPIDKVDFSKICEAAKTGDKLATRTLEEAAQYLSIAITNAIDHYDPELILLSGSVFQEDDYLYHKILANEPKRSFAFAASDVKIERSRLGANSEVVGAAALILKDFFNSGGNQ
jgi:N-acetylglucosamine repressor